MKYLITFLYYTGKILNNFFWQATLFVAVYTKNLDYVEQMLGEAHERDRRIMREHKENLIKKGLMQPDAD